MPIVPKLADRLKDRNAALKQQKELLSRIVPRGKAPAAPAAPPVAAPPKPPLAPPKVAAVRMQGDCIVTLSEPEPNAAQHLSRALRQCVDLYLEAAQCGNREVVLLWPLPFKCLPLIHAIATIEYWARGYKLGLRAVMYPATNQTFWGLNSVFASREDVHTMNNEVREVSFAGVNPAVKQSCEKKDLMLFALNSLKEEAKAAGLQPCLNELLPHFYLEKGERSEIVAQNYCTTYLSHLLSKLSKQGHAKALRETTLPGLGSAAMAPDAVFALSYKMTKVQIEQALRTLKAMAPVNVVLLDATRVAFDRVEKLQNRIAFIVRMVSEVFGENGPGIFIVTSDPRQMTQLRAALNREAQGHNLRFNFSATKALCHPVESYGLQVAETETPVVLASAAISVDVTDRESAKLLVSAFRFGREKGVTPALIEALATASKFVQTMANLPSSSELLHKWLDESLADDAQRRRFDWIAHRNRLKAALGDLEPDLHRRITEWIGQTDGVLKAQTEGTPLARTMLDRIKVRAGAGEKVLVAVQTRFYADLAKEYFLRDPDSERLRDRVQFTALNVLEKRLPAGEAVRVIVCALSPSVLRWVITTQTLHGPVDFLLTQQTAHGAHFALAPVLEFEEFRPYFARVQAIYNPIRGAHGAINAVMPDFDYQAPTFSLTTAGSGSAGHGERGPADYVEMEIEDGRRIHRGLGARVYLYDPAARESRALGFRVDDAENVKVGQQLFVMSEEMREEAEVIFARAGVTFDEASRYEKLLRQYHAQVLQRVRERFSGGLAEAARVICDAMEKAKVTQEAQNVRYWINLKNAEKTPYGELMPQAPRHFETFRVFMEVLGFDATAIQVFWDGAVKRVRGTRISDGLNLGDRYDRVLFDPEAAATYDQLTPEVLTTLRAGALDNVYEVAAVSFGTTTPRG